MTPKKKALAPAILATALAAGVFAIPSESGAIPQGPNQTDFGSFCGSSPDDCFNFETGDYGDPSACTDAKLYTSSTYIRNSSFSTLCANADIWVANDL